MIKVIKSHPAAQLPSKAHATDACFDLHGISQVVIEPGESAHVNTGIQLDIPDGYCGLVFSRSGMGFKSGVRLSNSVGVIDAEYQGDVMVALHNDGKEPYLVNAGDKVAQIMFMPVLSIDIEEADSHQRVTNRGGSGFGSTGR